MPDVHTKAVRSYNMSRIRSVDTKPELQVRRFLHARGFRYRLHDKMLPGKPDIVLPKYRILVFIHGCFWHGHKTCGNFTIPETNKSWWSNKIGLNIKRDGQNIKTLRKLNWRVIVVWECRLKKCLLSATLPKIAEKILTMKSSFFEI